MARKLIYIQRAMQVFGETDILPEHGLVLAISNGTEEEDVALYQAAITKAMEIAFNEEQGIGPRLRMFSKLMATFDEAVVPAGLYFDFQRHKSEAEAALRGGQSTVSFSA